MTRANWLKYTDTKAILRTMTVLNLLIVVVASGLAFVAYKHPNAYRVMFMFAIPVLVMSGLIVLAIKIGDLNGSIKSIYHELPNIRKYALSDQLPYQIQRLYGVGQFLKVFVIYYISGFAYLVFLLVLGGLLDLAKDRRHTPTWYGADVSVMQSNTRNFTAARRMPWFAFTMKLATWSKRTSTRASSKSGRAMMFVGHLANTNRRRDLTSELRAI
jgi:hypothetical protein